MGKVAKPLTIVVFPPLDEWPEFQKLEKQGHRIIAKIQVTDCVPPTLDVAWNLLKDADIILGPNCWYMTKLHQKHLTQAIKQARLRKYGSIAKRKKVDDNEKDDIPSSDPESPGC